MNTFSTIFRHELRALFYSPVALVYLAIFALLSTLLTFTLGDFYSIDEATLSFSFFKWHPMLFALFAPAIGMRAWTIERIQGTLETLYAQPIGILGTVLGKYAAACMLLVVSLLLTFPVVITVFWLGSPDVGELISGYIGSALLAFTFLAISSFFSAVLRSQVTVYLLSTTICIILALLGTSQLEGELVSIFPGSRGMVDFIASLSVNRYYTDFRRGLVEFQSLTYFGLIIAMTLLSTTALLNSRHD